MNILVTGGAGYIGSHTIIELIAHKHSVVVIDNFSNSQPESIKRVGEITEQKIPLYKGDVQNKTMLEKVFNENNIDAVIHFAGLKAVAESVRAPLIYYRNNINSSLSLCEVMQAKGIKKLIFSSSATVYSTPQELPLSEDSGVGIGITNPYGQTKYMIEQILRDLTVSDSSWEIVSLRYFNPIGAHESGKIGEDPYTIPDNLMPYIAQVAVGRREKLHVFGGDYDTPDGTGVRDYIHVVDVAKGHVAALEHLSGGKMEVYNLGTGNGVSVLEMLRAFEIASGQPIPYEIVGRRAGDIAAYYANASKAQRELGWHAEKTIENACVDTWRWQSQNPHGYQ